MSGNSVSGTRYGFVGVGTMSSAIVRGLCTLPAPATNIVLSPRGAERAAALAKDFPSMCTIAASNQEVLDKSDVIFVGVLPKQCEEVLRGLNFDSRHTVVSLVSTAQLAMLKEVCAPIPTDRVIRAIPLPSVAKHHGACVMSPPHPLVVSLFDSLGTVVAVETEEQMKKMMPVTALMGQFYAQQGDGAVAAGEWRRAGRRVEMDGRRLPLHVVRLCQPDTPHVCRAGRRADARRTQRAGRKGDDRGGGVQGAERQPRQLPRARRGAHRAKAQQAPVRLDPRVRDGERAEAWRESERERERENGDWPWREGGACAVPAL